jgi:transcriptional regulator with XRE-family HTH domain
MSTVGSRVKEGREAKNWSQDDLAKRLSTSRTLVSAWERDETHPRGSTRLKIANALGLHTEWLRTGEGPRTLEEGQESTIQLFQDADRLVAQHIYPAFELTQQVLKDQGVDLGDEPLAKVVMRVAMRGLMERRELTTADVTEALVAVLQGA